MTATESLRQLLDERGVEWDKGAFPNEARTYWQDTVARPWDTQRLYVHALLTPEQAVEATLGRGTCKVEGSIDYGEFGCWQYDLSCGCRILWPDSEPPTFCPECGRRVEE